MSLQFIMGPSGSGKSHYLYQWVTDESIKSPDKNYIVLVPDQFTMQTQKDLVMASPRKGIMNVDVLSFNRLAYRIFEEMGGNNKIILNDVGKSFVLRKIAGNCQQDLKMLGSNLKKIGFISEIKSVISEFMQYDITSQTLEELLSEMNPSSSFYYKLKDINTIYKGFQEYLQGKYITGEEVLDLLCQAVPKSNILKDSVIVLDGFTGFTPVQNKLLRELFLTCEKVVVTVTKDVCAKKISLFDMSDKMITSLEKIAGECGINVESPIKLYEKPVYRYRDNEELAFLESNLFRYSNNCYEKEPEQLKIYEASNAKTEIDFVAQEIRRMVRTEGLRYRDIAIISGDLSAYANYMEKIFANYDIPLFMDHKRSILINSFVEYLRSLLAMGEQNFTYESVFRYLRTELTVLTREEVDVLENYCLALGIRGRKAWNEKWIRKTKNMSEEELLYVNEIRERFMTSIEDVMETLKARFKTVESVTRALHEFLMKNELQQKVKEYETRFNESGELALAKEYAQVYRIVMELFDQFVELLGDERISLKEYCELLDAGLQEAKVGVIPPSLDQVVAGDIERTRIKDVKVIFFVGVNDSYIPGQSKKGGLLSERDRERFEEKKIALAPGTKEKSFIQKFYIYMILTKPSEQIILTYNCMTSERKAKRPAYIIFDILKMYPKLQVKEAVHEGADKEFTQKSGLSYLVRGLQRKEACLEDKWKELYGWYKKHPEWHDDIEKIIEAAFYQNPEDTLTKETAKALYGTLLKNSVSRLEKFSKCAYAHFIDHGLQLKERELYEFIPLDWGNIIHGALEKFAKKIEKKGYTWTNIVEEEREAVIEECVEESIVDYDNSILYSSARNEYTIEKLKRVAKRAVWLLSIQLEKGEFTPNGYEITYDSGSISLKDSKAMRLHGKIDRVDTCETKDQVFVKVIDYKTGKVSFSLSDLYYGLQMQLVIYLSAVMRMEKEKYPDKKIIPAGLLYCGLQDPIIERGQDLLEELKPSGVVNKSEEVLEYLEKEKVAKSKILPVSRNKNESISAASSVLTEEEFDLITRFAEHKAKEIGNEILNGEISVSPAGEDACKYCNYKGICGFDETIPGFHKRSLPKMKNPEVIAKLREEEESWE